MKKYRGEIIIIEDKPIKFHLDKIIKNNNSNTFETYARLLAVKPVKKGDAYLERLKWIITLIYMI